MNHRRMAALTLLMKHIRHRDMMELLDKLPQVMVEISDEQVRVLIHYIVNAGTVCRRNLCGRWLSVCRSMRIN